MSTFSDLDYAELYKLHTGDDLRSETYSDSEESCDDDDGPFEMLHKPPLYSYEELKANLVQAPGNFLIDTSPSSEDSGCATGSLEDEKASPITTSELDSGGDDVPLTQPVNPSLGAPAETRNGPCQYTQPSPLGNVFVAPGNFVPRVNYGPYPFGNHEVIAKNVSSVPPNGSFPGRYFGPPRQTPFSGRLEEPYLHNYQELAANLIEARRNFEARNNVGPYQFGIDQNGSRVTPSGSFPGGPPTNPPFVGRMCEPYRYNYQGLPTNQGEVPRNFEATLPRNNVGPYQLGICDGIGQNVSHIGASGYFPGGYVASPRIPPFGGNLSGPYGYNYQELATNKIEDPRNFGAMWPRNGVGPYQYGISDRVGQHVSTPNGTVPGRYFDPHTIPAVGGKFYQPNQYNYQELARNKIEASRNFGTMLPGNYVGPFQFGIGDGIGRNVLRVVPTGSFPGGYFGPPTKSSFGGMVYGPHPYLHQQLALNEIQALRNFEAMLPRTIVGPDQFAIRDGIGLNISRNVPMEFCPARSSGPSAPLENPSPAISLDMWYEACHYARQGLKEKVTRDQRNLEPIVQSINNAAYPSGNRHKIDKNIAATETGSEEADVPSAVAEDPPDKGSSEMELKPAQGVDEGGNFDEATVKLEPISSTNDDECSSGCREDVDIMEEYIDQKLVHLVTPTKCYLCNVSIQNNVGIDHFWNERHVKEVSRWKRTERLQYRRLRNSGQKQDIDSVKEGLNSTSGNLEKPLEEHRNPLQDAVENPTFHWQLLEEIEKLTDSIYFGKNLPLEYVFNRIQRVNIVVEEYKANSNKFKNSDAMMATECTKSTKKYKELKHTFCDLKIEHKINVFGTNCESLSIIHQNESDSQAADENLVCQQSDECSSENGTDYKVKNTDKKNWLGPFKKFCKLPWKRKSEISFINAYNIN